MRIALHNSKTQNSSIHISKIGVVAQYMSNILFDSTIICDTKQSNRYINTGILKTFYFKLST
jgi:hypothetical protein